MADEVTILNSLQIKKGNLSYRSHPTAFKADIAGTEKGPVPGAMTVDNAGDNVDLTELTTPGLCRISNLEEDEGNRLEYGIWDPDTGKFYPLGEADPGEFYTIKLSRNLSSEYGTGTGTTGASANSLRVRAITGTTCICLVEAFEA